MFSYRHAFHAGNHADVLKHTVLIAVLQYMTQKEVGLTVVDTHAGAGLYRLDSGAATRSGEVSEGLQALKSRLDTQGQPSSPALAAYLRLLSDFNPKAGSGIYPGSPLICHHLLREQDKLKLFELHPTDILALSGHVEQLRAGRQIAVLREDGFEGVKKFLPPPSRRGLVLMDPSYEIKADYGRVTDSIQDCLKRFATGTYLIWYPVIPRPQAHSLPKNLIRLAQQARKPWLHATLRIKSGMQRTDGADFDPEQRASHSGMSASGMVVINPPHTLRGDLQAALPEMVSLMGQDKWAGFTLDSAG